MISRLDEDLSTLGQISKLSETLSFPHQVLQTRKAAPCLWYIYITSYMIEVDLYHFFLLCISQSLDEVIKDLMASVHRELSDKQSLAFSMTFLPTKLEFTTASAESSFVFEFASPDTRSNFEQAFEDAKKKLGQSILIKGRGYQCFSN